MCEKPKRQVNGQQRADGPDDRRRRAPDDAKERNGQQEADEQRKKPKLEDEDDEHHHGYDYSHSEGVVAAPGAGFASSEREQSAGQHGFEHQHAASDDEDDDHLDNIDEDDNSLANTSTSAAGDHEQGGEYVCNFCNKVRA